MDIVYLNVELFIDACDGNYWCVIYPVEFVLKAPRTSVLEYSRGINWDQPYCNIYYVRTYFTRVQHDGIAGFVMQDLLCRLLAHMIILELILYIYNWSWHMTHTYVLGTVIS